jgi:hypothetical protein
MPIKKINTFVKGKVTRIAHGKQPDGSFYDSKNLVPNSKIGALCLRTGVTASTEVVAATSGNTITTTVDFHKVSTENPSAQDITLMLGTTAGSVKKIVQSPWFDVGGTVRTTGLEWGETLTTTISSVSTPDVVIANGSTTDDYYNGWIIYKDSTLPCLITNYVGSSKTCTLDGWVPDDFAGGQTVYLARGFHDNPAFTPSYVTPGTERSVCLCHNDALLFSGGKSSTAGCVAMHCKYTSKTFFASLSSGLVWSGTYVSEAEIDTTGVVASTALGSAMATLLATSTVGLNVNLKWFAAVIGETDDGQKSQVLASVGIKPTPSGTYPAQALLMCTIVKLAMLNKRFKKLHFFLGSTSAVDALSLDYKDYYYIKSIDMTDTAYNTTASGVSYVYTDYLVASTATSAPKSYNYYVYFDNSHWLQKGENLVEFIGHPYCTSTTMSFSQAILESGRLVVARYHDYSDGLDYNDSIRYSIFDGYGVPNINVLPNLTDFSESIIAQGDPSSIQGMAKYNGKVLILKNRASRFTELTYNPLEWRLVDVAEEIGCDVPTSVVATPYGIIFAKSGDDIYLWDGGYPKSLLESTWLDVYRALATTYKANWMGWYNALDKSYNLYIKDDGFVYSMHFDIGNAWTKHDYTMEPQIVRTRSDGRVYYRGSGYAAYTLRYFSTNTQDVSTSIAPYYDSGEILLEEKDLVTIDKFFVNFVGTGTAANNLDVQVLVDNAVVKEFAAVTKTKTRIESILPYNIGRTVRIKFNTDGSPATWATSFELYEIGFDYVVKPFVGDMTQTL